MDVLIISAVICAAAAGFFIARWGIGVYVEIRRRERAREIVVSEVSVHSGFNGLLGRLCSRRQQERQRLAIERHVPEMLDAVALGMRSGLSFESAFRLYGSRFDDELALACRRACQSWESGLVSRDEALRKLADEVDVPSLTRFVSNILRALRFGSPIGRILESLASETRSCYRAKMEERVAKTPVKMLMPTAALILPAMLIMMMGPVVLEFVG